MTPEQMAEEAGVHASTIRNWEQDRRTPKKSVVVVYAGGNDVLRDWLMEAWEVRSRCGSIAEWDLELDNLLVPA